MKRSLGVGAKVAAAEVMLAFVLANQALAQRVMNGGGADAPFAAGITTGLNWVHFAAAAIAVIGFLAACLALFMRNITVAVGGFLAIIIGGTLLANANDIMSTLTGMQFT